MELPPVTQPDAEIAQTVSETETDFVRLTAAELGFSGSEMVEYGPWVASVDQTLLECDPISHLGPEIARMAIAQGIELYKQNHPEAEEETDADEETETEAESDQAEESTDQDAKKKLI